MDDLAGRVALVTGASRGLGRAIALALAEAGCDLALGCRSRTDLAEAAASEICSTGRRAVVCAADLGAADGCVRIARAALNAFDRVDLLIGCAGIAPDRLLLRLPPDEFDRVLDVNLTANARLAQALLPGMLERGWGRMAFVGSRAGMTGGYAGQAAYAASKAALVGLTRSLAREAGPSVTVNCFLPGYLPTDMGLAAGEAVMERAREESLTGRLADPADAAEAIVALLRMPGLSGQVLSLDARPC